jgi:hypothetical protein
MKFYKLAIGAHFTVRGERFTKCGMSAAEDERRWGHTFFGIMDVEPEGEPLLLPPVEAVKWKPNYGPWTEFMEREFGAESAETRVEGGSLGSEG